MSELFPLQPIHQHDRSSNPPTVGERSVACFEAAKGILVILAGFGLLSLMHHDLQHFVHAFVDHLHLSRDSSTSDIFLSLGSASTGRLWALAALSCAYAALRLTEAFGLWTGKHWAKWIAVAGGGLYIPLEAYELMRGVSWIKLAAFALNAGIVLYMIYALRRDQRMTELA